MANRTTRPSAVRRDIFVELQTKIEFSPVGAAYSVRISNDVAPNGAFENDCGVVYKYVSPNGLFPLAPSRENKKSTIHNRS
jgi:hypothetical protein